MGRFSIEKTKFLKCKQCGKVLPISYSTDVCLECSRKNVQAIFKQHPDVKRAFKETVEELKKPENIEKMANDTVKFMKAIQDIQKGSRHVKRD